MNELSQLQVKQMKGPAVYGVGSRPKTRRKLRVTANRPPVKHEEPVHNCKTVHKQVLCQKCGNNHSKRTTDLAKGNQCGYCQKLNHFTIMCRAKGKDKKGIIVNEVSDMFSYDSDEYGSESESESKYSIDWIHLDKKHKAFAFVA